MTIPLMKVHMPPPEVLMPALKEVLYSGFVSEGAQVKKFEEKLQYAFDINSRPLSVNSGTSALQLAYRCANVKKKIVLATPMTCTATNMPILQEGAEIVWCDIDPDTGNISVDSVRQMLKDYQAYHDVSAISFVDFAGYPADLDGLSRLAKEHGVSLVEDAAQSIGAKWNGKYIGSDPKVDFVCFSFQAIKHLTTIDGGALIVNGGQAVWDRAKSLKWYGINREAVKEATRWHYDIPEAGYKGHMNNVNATVGIAQLDYLGGIIRRHKKNGMFFDENLKNIPGLKLMKIPDPSEPSYWIYMVRVERRDDFARMMLERGISVNVAHIRNDTYSCFKKCPEVLNFNASEKFPGLNTFNSEYIAIPCGWWVSDEDREFIVETIKQGW